MLGSFLAVCVLLFLPLWMGKIGPNPFYGYCTKFARSSPEHWYPLNRLASRLYLPFFAMLAPADLFLDDKEIIWILLPGVLVIFLIVRLDEWRRKRRIKRHLAAEAKLHKAAAGPL